MLMFFQNQKQSFQSICKNIELSTGVDLILQDQKSNLCNQIWSKNEASNGAATSGTCQLPDLPQLQWDVDVIDKYIMQTIC